jgi:hypothetical protein
VVATCRLARKGLTDAEIVRALQPLTPRVGRAAPSYFAVRRIAAAARVSDTPMNPYLDEPLTKLAPGRMPDFSCVDSFLATQAAFERERVGPNELSPARRSAR